MARSLCSYSNGPSSAERERSDSSKDEGVSLTGAMAPSRGFKWRCIFLKASLPISGIIVRRRFALEFTRSGSFTTSPETYTEGSFVIFFNERALSTLNSASLIRCSFGC